MTNQEIFDTVKTHLLTQMEKSIAAITEHNNDICAYRGLNGLKCAIGCLIPDELYSRKLEGKAVACLPTKIIQSIGRNVELLTQLQELHDHMPVENWKVGLKRIAKEFNLNF